MVLRPSGLIGRLRRKYPSLTQTSSAHGPVSAGGIVASGGGGASGEVSTSLEVGEGISGTGVSATGISSLGSTEGFAGRGSSASPDKRLKVVQLKDTMISRRPMK